MTTYIQTFEGLQPETVRPDGWRPWINCKDRAETVQLAVHRHVRNRGGIGHGEKLTLHVLDYQEGTAMHKNGNPKLPTLTTFTLTKP